MKRHDDFGSLQTDFSRCWRSYTRAFGRGVIRDRIYAGDHEEGV